MAKKFYAVKKGLTPGIYLDWDSCKAQVDGFPGAEYKGFNNLADAGAYLGISDPVPLGNDGPTPKTPPGNDGPCPYLSIPSDEIVAYVDGSYNNATKEFSYGAVIFYKGEEHHLSEKADTPELVEMRNVAGEIKGSEAAMDFALEYGAKKITIYHDYEGIAKWCTGEWKTNKEGTIAYKEYYLEASKKLAIEFKKVTGHSGDKYNDLADSLAKKALGIE